MWYYVIGNEKAGPVDDSAIEDLIQNSTITADTLLWQEGMENWQPAKQTRWADRFIETVSAVRIEQPAKNQHYPINFQPESLKNLWLWFAWLIGIGTPLAFFIIGWPMLIAATVIGYILLYRFWVLLQGSCARTTPGIAVGFCFIPFFNLYWIYVAFVGLSKDMNLHCNQHNIIGPRVNEQLALTWYILSLTTAIPYIGILTAIPVAVIHIIMVKQFVDTSTAIMESNG